MIFMKLPATRWDQRALKTQWSTLVLRVHHTLMISLYQALVNLFPLSASHSGFHKSRIKYIIWTSKMAHLIPSRDENWSSWLSQVNHLVQNRRFNSHEPEFRIALPEMVKVRLNKSIPDYKVNGNSEQFVHLKHIVASIFWHKVVKMVVKS